MAAAQVFIALWAASLAVAAPQGTELRSVKDTSINQDQVVSQVVDSLGPAVSKAVAEALTSLNQANSVVAARAVSNAATESPAFEADLVKDNITAEPTARPVYNFEYKVADDTAQTYISLNEVRDGSDLTGEYSYVDANGGLVTVNYLAGPRGYSETREVQDGFVEITAKPTKSKVEVDAVAAARAEARKFEAAKLDAARLEAAEQEAVRLETARLEASRLEAARVEAVRLEAARLEAEQESAFIDQSSLIDQVLAILQPLISNTVQEAISTSSSPSTSSSSTSLSSSSISDSSLSTGEVSSTFGTNSLSVSVETPEFQFAF